MRYSNNKLDVSCGCDIVKLCNKAKEYNKFHSKKRIILEHTICRLKQFKILADLFRNRLKKHNKVSDIVSGLVNYKIMNHHNRPELTQNP